MKGTSTRQVPSWRCLPAEERASSRSVPKEEKGEKARKTTQRQDPLPKLEKVVGENPSEEVRHHSSPNLALIAHLQLEDSRDNFSET